jgi:hypothetical protein
MKDYIKPGISFQFFNLTSNLAGGCSVKSNEAEYVCPVQLPGYADGETVFVRGSCFYATQNPEDHNVCYGVPVADSRVLGS